MTESFRLRPVRRELDVQLVSRDPAGAAAFYRDVLGLALAADSEAVEPTVSIGGHRIEIVSAGADCSMTRGGTARAIGMRLLAFVLDDLASVTARLDAAGHRYQAPPVPRSAPYSVAFTADPDGNALELVGLAKPAGEALTARLQIGLTVRDAARSREFYGSALGLREEPPMKLPPTMGVAGDVRYGFLAGRTTIKFWSYDRELPVETGAPATRTGIRRLCARVDDVDTLHAVLCERGVSIEAPPHDGPNGRAMNILDPDGNLIELAQRG